MQLSFDFTDIINVSMNTAAWILVGVLVYRGYVKMIDKPKAWKVILVVLVGLFTFDINMNQSNLQLIRIPILPLGVWILYAALNREAGRWQRYRSFAWIGFLANFIFLAAALISWPIYDAVYPQDEIRTYIARGDDISIVHLHPSAKENVVLKEDAIESIKNMKQGSISMDWYYESRPMNETEQSNEKFPYLLTGTGAKWGSGLSTLIYLQADGRGLIIETKRGQNYFRTDTSLIEETAHAK
jgi:hypothetical protein